MRITDLIVKVITKRLATPLWNPQAVWREKSALLVFIETDEGITGVGEAWCEGGSPASIAAVIEHDIKPALLGGDPFFSNRIWETSFRRMIASAKHGTVFAALSAIDIALWDIVGKSTNQPIYKLLGAASDKIFVYASGGLYGEEKGCRELASEMAQYVARGFRGVKIKIGGAPFRDDVARVAAVRGAIGDDVRLIVDACYALSVPQALKLADALQKYDIYCFETPVSRYDVRGMATVNARGPIPVSGSKFAFGRYAFQRLIESDAVTIVNCDAILCGGIGESIKIANIAAGRHLSCSFHSASSVICFAANLHAAAATVNCDSIEWHMIHQLLWDDAAEAAFRLEDGYVNLPAKPGLGIELKPDRL